MAVTLITEPEKLHLITLSAFIFKKDKTLTLSFHFLSPPLMKVKIHPSPAPDAAVAAVLRLLPAAIVALSAALGAEDREVLAYLIMRSAAAADDHPRRRGTGGAGHRAVFDCGCFDCYTGFWYRWDCSPNRELIHQAIEAFEESLTKKERGKGRRKGRKGSDRNMKAETETETETPVVVCSDVKPPATVTVTEAVCEVEEKVEEEKDEVEEVGERRGRWPDLVGMIQQKVLSFWGPEI